jgi:ribosomal subunit interface protein
MTIKVTGKNIEAGEAFQTYVTAKLSSVLEKYIGPEVGGHVRVEKERGRFRTLCSILLRTGLPLEAQGEAGDAYSSADVALERLEKRVRRYKRRLKNHHHGAEAYSLPAETSATDYVVRVDEEGNETDDREMDAPLIVAESERVVREMTVSEAVMHLDLTEDAFLVFRNAGHGGINIVYRRADGNIGWIDPQSGTSKRNSGVATLSKS